MGQFSKVSPGDVWRPNAEKENALTDLLNRFSGVSPGIMLPNSSYDGSILTVQNVSDRTLDYNRAVELVTEHKFDKMDINSICVPGKPVEDEECFWGIALDNIPPGKIGRVKISGVHYLPEVWGARPSQISYNGNPEPFYQNYINPRKNGAFELNNRGRARVLWWQTIRKESQGSTMPPVGRAVVLLNTPDSYIYDGMFAVKDKGSRVPENEIPYVFNSFWRGSNAEQVEGNGLGLYEASFIARKLGGDVAARYLEDTGEMEFEVFIPL
jgi:hypothetical protein